MTTSIQHEIKPMDENDSESDSDSSSRSSDESSQESKSSSAETSKTIPSNVFVTPKKLHSKYSKDVVDPRNNYAVVLSGVHIDTVEELLNSLKEQGVEQCHSLPMSRVKVLKSLEEKDIHKKQYRKAYRERPDVKLMLEKNAKDEKKKEQKKEYAKKPEVKQRKAELNKVKNEYFKKIVRNEPVCEFEEYKNQHLTKISRKRKHDSVK